MRFYHPYLLLVLASLFWSGNVVTGRAIRDEVGPFTLSFFRWTIVLVLALPWVLPHFAKDFALAKKGWKSLLLLAFLGVTGYNTLVYIALQSTTATNANLLNSFIPIATLALAWLFLKRVLSPLAILGVLVSLAGVCTIVMRGALSTLTSLSLNVGDLWMMLSVFAWAFYTIGLSARPKDLSPFAFLFFMTAAGLLMLLPLVAFELMQGTMPHFSVKSVWGIAYIGIFPAFLGFVFYNRGVLEVGPAKASLFIHLMPVFGTLLATLFLGEEPHVFHGVGIFLILSGIWLTSAK